MGFRGIRRFGESFARGFGVTGGAGVSQATFQVTTTAPGQTLTINSLGVSAAVIVGWGDGSSNSYTGTALRTHVYASAGTYTVMIDKPLLVTVFDLRDTKVMISGTQISKFKNLTSLILNGLTGLTWTVGASAPMPTGLTTLYLNSLTGLTWTVGASAPMPTGLTTLYLYGLTGLTWTVGASAPMPTGLTALTLNSLTGLTWTVGASAPMPTGLTYLYLTSLTGLTGNLSAFTMSVNATELHCFSTNVTGDGFPTLNKLTVIELQSNGWTQPTVTTVLLAIYSHFATRSVSGGTINVGGSNAAPDGAYAAECPPTHGKNAAYELVNDSCAVNPTKKWTTVTFTA